VKVVISKSIWILIGDEMLNFYNEPLNPIDFLRKKGKFNHVLVKASKAYEKPKVRVV
jgi:hypothetical protein